MNVPLEFRCAGRPLHSFLLQICNEGHFSKEIRGHWKRRCKLIPTDPENIRTLEFKSWWTEDHESADLTFRDNCSQIGGGLRKRYMTLKFDRANLTFDLEMGDDDQEVKLVGLKNITAKNGAPLDCWDLHVGAKLDIMGKTVLLIPDIHLLLGIGNLPYSVHYISFNSHFQMKLRAWKKRKNIEVKHRRKT